MTKSSHTILIIAANDTLGPTLLKRMQEYGYRVIMATDEQAALDESLRQLPNIVLVERQRFHGRLRVLIDTLWRNPAMKQVPIVTFADPQMPCCEEEWVMDLDGGFDACLCNMTLRQVVAYARAILRTVQHSKAPREILEVDRLRMDLARHEMRVKGNLVELTPREFLIMKEFMKMPRRVLSRQELLNRVWGEDFAMEEHVLDVHIHSLRQKIEQDPSRPTLIVTVRGVGYKLQAGKGEGMPAVPVTMPMMPLSKSVAIPTARYAAAKSKTPTELR
jgi:two-component system response regulator RegX3